MGNNVLLVKIGLGRFGIPSTIRYHHSPVLFQGLKYTPLFSSTNSHGNFRDICGYKWQPGISRLRIDHPRHLLRSLWTLAQHVQCGLLELGHHLAAKPQRIFFLQKKLRVNYGDVSAIDIGGTPKSSISMGCSMK